MRLLLKVKNIETMYGLIYALRGLSLDLEEGTVTTVLGGNGSGKSTVMKTVMGLIENQPEKGQIEFRDKRIDGKDTETIVRMGLSYVPEGRELFGELSVRENLLMGAYIRRDRRGIKEDFMRIFHFFPVLKAREKQDAGTLSGGEQQMLAMGRALMNRPSLLMLDEPSLGLSPLLVKEIFRIIRTINNEGVTILLVEQNARVSLAVSDFGLILENGRFVMKGKSRELMEDKDVQEFYMGVRSQDSIRGDQRWKRKKRWR